MPFNYSPDQCNFAKPYSALLPPLMIKIIMFFSLILLKAVSKSRTNLNFWSLTLIFDPNIELKCWYMVRKF